MAKSFQYPKKGLWGIGGFLIVLVALLLYTRFKREGFQTTTPLDLTQYEIFGRNVWATDAAINEAFGSIVGTSSPIEINQTYNFTIMLTKSYNNLTNDNTEIKSFTIYTTDTNRPSATTIDLSDIGKIIPESSSTYPITLNSYRLYTRNPQILDIYPTYPSDRPLYPYELLGMRYSSTDSTMKRYFAISEPGISKTIKDSNTSTILYDSTNNTNILTDDNVTIKLYDVFFTFNGMLAPADYQNLSTPIDQQLDPTGADPTVLKSYIIKDNINNTTIFKSSANDPPIVLAPPTTSTSGSSTGTSTPTTDTTTSPTTNTTTAPTTNTTTAPTTNTTTAPTTTTTTPTTTTTTPTTTTTTPTTTTTTTPTATTTTTQAAGTTPAVTTKKKDEGLSTGAFVVIGVFATAAISGGIFAAIVALKNRQV